MLDALAWYAAVQLAALAAWPFVGRALGGLDDRGWAAGKSLGLLAVAWLVWLVCMLAPVPFTRLALAVGLAAIGALGWLGLRGRPAGAELWRWARARRRSLAVWEALFLAAFAAFALLRAHDPAVAGTDNLTEKPMDMAFLNGFVAAERLPTQDTWLSGYGVPYYYFGYFVFACLTKLSGVPPGVGYNLAAATVPALALLGLAALAWNLARAAGSSARWAAAGAGLAALLALIAGNLSTLFELLVALGRLSPGLGPALGIKRFAEGVTPGVWPPAGPFWWFRASRIVPNIQPDGINEFPFFSALLSDLHPHFVALPFEVLVLTVAASHVLSRGHSLRSRWTQATAALALGALLALNTWDVAPFWLLYIGLGLLAAGRPACRCGGTAARWSAGRALATVAAGPLGGALLFAPYFVGYSSPPLGLGLVAERTPLSSLLVLFGGQILLLASLGLLARWWAADRRGWLLAGGGAALGVALAARGEPTLGLLVALVALLVPWPGVLEALEPAESMVVALAAFAAAILLGVELVYLDDVFHSRMNTVFKFHENVWLLAGLAAGAGLAVAARRALRARWAVAAGGALALAAGLVYPASAVPTRLAASPPGGLTLDGTAFLAPDDGAAVRWLRSQTGGATRPVIAEAAGKDYTAAGRIATSSGAAAVLGWVGHELQWRGPLPELRRREADLAALYGATPAEGVRAVLERYRVRFVVVGDLEREQYGPGVAARLEAILPVAFRSGRTVVLRADQGSPSAGPSR